MSTTLSILNELNEYLYDNNIFNVEFTVTKSGQQASRSRLRICKFNNGGIMECFVYYEDDFFDMGGIGFKEFKSEVEAIKFIEERLSKVENPRIQDYTLIRGKKMSLQVVEYATKILAIE